MSRFGAEGHYPWDPAQGNEITVFYRETRGGAEVFVCALAEDAGVVIPAWIGGIGGLQ